HCAGLLELRRLSDSAQRSDASRLRRRLARSGSGIARTHRFPACRLSPHHRNNSADRCPVWRTRGRAQERTSIPLLSRPPIPAAYGHALPATHGAAAHSPGLVALAHLSPTNRVCSELCRAESRIDRKSTRL